MGHLHRSMNSHSKCEKRDNGEKAKIPKIGSGIQITAPAKGKRVLPRNHKGEKTIKKPGVPG